MYEYQRILQPTRSSENDQRMSSDCRKSNKPLLEKKRRARINRSLDQLKTLLIDAIKNDHATGYSKLEKADILELAVKYLRNIRGQQISALSAGESSVAARYRDGFSECAQEVDRFLASVSGLGHDTRHRLMSHLATCIKQPPPPPPPRRAHIHPPATFGAPALNPGIYGVQLPPTSAASLTTGRVDFTSGSESTVGDVTTPSLDGRRRSLSVAAAPYGSVVFPSFIAAPPVNGRLSVCPLFPVGADDDQQAAAILSGESSSFRPIEPASTGDRCSSTNSDELDDEMTRCDARSDVDEDADCQSRGGVASSSSREVVSGRPLTQKNDNSDNIARGFLDAQKRDVQGPDAAAAGVADQSVMMFMMAMNDDVKDEHVWRPW